MLLLLSVSILYLALGIYTLALIAFAFPAFAAEAAAVVAVVDPNSINLTTILLAFIGLIGTVLTTVLPLIINARMKDKQAAEVASAAIKNSVGAAQRVAEGYVTKLQPSVSVMGLSKEVSAGMQYALDQAPDALNRLGITNEMLADKVSAQIGLANVKANQAIAASPEPSPKPLDAVPVVDAPARNPQAPEIPFRGA